MQELLLRVQHILQRAYRAELSRTKPAPLQLGERCVDLNDAIVTLPEGKTLALTATELALLRKLAENRGHIVTYDGCTYPASAGEAGSRTRCAAVSADGAGHWL